MTPAPVGEQHARPPRAGRRRSRRNACRDYAAGLTKHLDERLAKESRRPSELARHDPVHRARRARRLPDADDLFAGGDDPPVLVADEPDPAKPDDWLIHAYFEHEPSGEELAHAGRPRQRRRRASSSSARPTG